MFRKEKLKEAIIKRNLKDVNIANILGISKQALSLKMCGKTRWTIDDVYTLKSTIGLTEREIDDIFFE